MYNGDSIFIATEPRFTDTEDSDGPPESFLMSSLTEEPLSTFDSPTSWVSELERAFARTLVQLKWSRSQSTGEFTGEIEWIQRNRRAMRDR
jgi:hypothetical protein